MNVCGVLLRFNHSLWGGKGNVSCAIEWTFFFFLNEKIQKNLIKVPIARQHFFLDLTVC